MPTEFNDATSYGMFVQGTTLNSSTGKYVRQSELTLAALRAAGVLDNLEDGLVPPNQDKLWLDKNTDPAVLKKYSTASSSWEEVSFESLLGTNIIQSVAVTGGTGNAIVVAAIPNIYDNKLYSITPIATNTGATTIQVPGVGTFNALYADGTPVAASEFVVGQPKLLFFKDGAFRVLLSTSSIFAAVTPISANSMLVDNAAGTQRQTKTFAEVRTLLDLQGVDRTLQFYGAVGDGVANDTTAVNSASLVAKASNKKINGLGLIYKVDAIPSRMLSFKNAAFLVDGEIYPTQDFTNASLKKITETDFMSGWCQEMACVYNKRIIVPFKYGYRDEFFTSRYAFSVSFDGGYRFSKPEIFLDYHPNSPTYGYNTFSAGVKHNRFIVGVEERLTSDRSLTAIFLYDRLLNFSYRMTNNGIALVNGSPIATITLENHGLVVGDFVYFSGVSGTGTGGLSGKLAVASVIDHTKFTVNKGSNSTVTNSNTGGTEWNIASAWSDNAWRITSIPMFQNVNGVPLTGLHSFEDNPTDPNKFWIGYNNGITPREVGAIIVDNWYSTPTFSTTKIQQAQADFAAEPSLRYNPDDGNLYLTTRGASVSQGGTSFNWMTPAGVWTGHKLPGVIHNGPVPFEIDGNDLYMFGTERGENEWKPNTPLNRWTQNRPRTFMLKVPLDEAKVGNFTNYTETLLGYGIFNGEENASGNGVGSTIKTDTDIWYFFGSQDWRLKNRYSNNPSPANPAAVNPFIQNGIPEDIYAFKVPINVRAGINDIEFLGTPTRGTGMSRFDNRILMEGPIDVTNGVKFSGRIDYKTHPTPVVVGSTGILTLPTSSSSDYIVDTFGSAATGDIIRIDPPAGQIFTNGTVIVLQAASSSRDHTYKHNAVGGNLRNIGSVDITAPNAQSSVCYKYFNGIFNMQYSALI